jgi:hypothetical protein
VPTALSNPPGAVTAVVSGLLEYSSRSDWPMNWAALRSRFPIRANLGQWLRWEAALEEIRAYYSVASEFRLQALTTFGDGVARIIEASPSLRMLPPQQRPESADLDDEELAQPTIFPFLIRHAGRVLSLDDCKKVYLALSRDRGDADEGGREREFATKPCLVGQPVAVGAGAALRICASARLVTQASTSDQATACGNLQRELGNVGAVVAKIEWLAARIDDL